MLARNTYNEYRFRSQVDSALSKVKTILDTTRTPRYAEDEDHTYGDKFGLAEFLTNTAMAAQANVLERLGMNDESLRKLHSFVSKDKRSVTLRFIASETCEFSKEEVVKVESKHEFVTETEKTETNAEDDKNEKTMKTTTRHKVITNVTEYHWKVCMNYSLFAFAGNDPDDSKTILQSREASHVIVTTGGKTSPFPSKTAHDPIDVPLTWLLQNIAEDSFACSFTINRSTESCHTPRRNEDISAAIVFFNELENWSSQVKQYFLSISHEIANTSPERSNPSPFGRPVSLVGLSSINADGIFVPILPLFERPTKDGVGDVAVPKPTKTDVSASKSEDRLISLDERKEEETSLLLPTADVNLFLNEQCRSLGQALVDLAVSFPANNDQSLVSVAEASLVLLAQHIISIKDHFCDGVDYIEEMLRSQLVSAIGKEVQSEDFSEFILFDNRKLFKTDFVPKPFCHAIRRPKHYPDGVLSIERDQSGTAPSKGKDNPVVTFMRQIEGSSAMTFPINAATSVEFTGERFLHAWVCHQFGQENESNSNFKLVARARQFSSFLLLIGTVSGPDSFEPQHAIILQNKDEVLIPLLLNQLPTPKEFKDAIQSLSPEQQRFAKAFRSMQLESSVFGVCAVQLKPQLEVLLGLPHNSLTKEVRLTQDLLSLFIDYQISSDLLSFDGDMSMTASEKVAVVKGHVAAVQEMIEEMKENDLKNAEQEADMHLEMSGASRGFSFGAAPAAQRSRYEARGRKMSSCAASTPTFSNRNIRGGGAPAAQRSRYEARGREILSCADATPTLQKSSADSEQVKLEGMQPYNDSNSTDIDFTLIPKQLDAKFEALDSDSAMRPTVIKSGDIWTKRMQENLLTKMHEETLTSDEQKKEKNKAFDLLDALSRSGSLPVACAELHVFVAATHCFENSLMETVIQDNINPIERMEKSMLIVASTIFELPPAGLLKNKSEETRVAIFSPDLFDETNEG
eukprot:CAMPEP_0185726428 /NCGR_PEP_ID=MMETSP1171-20130828/2414_1 /TAXON_ID=374046 /ORGANISM="Helicotheca tamensis, Strain CCMP826" /LENGTH=970 /DNA_ID=CAMNT_0028394785 /DNA_START=84 /DNA_END=2996 /DNA_ORIENTATION=-